MSILERLHDFSKKNLPLYAAYRNIKKKEIFIIYTSVENWKLILAYSVMLKYFYAAILVSNIENFFLFTDIS